MKEAITIEDLERQLGRVLVEQKAASKRHEAALAELKRTLDMLSTMYDLNNNGE